MTSVLLAVDGAVESSQIPIRTIREIRALNQLQAGQALKVRVQAAVTFQNHFGDCFVQDAQDAIYVSRRNSSRRLMPGMRVEIIGRTAPGDYAPVLIEDSVRILSSGSVLAPDVPDFDALSAGRMDGRWVEIRGVVRSARDIPNTRREASIAFGGAKVDAHLYEAEHLDLQRLVGATVVMRGAVGGRFNQKRQLVAPLLFVSAKEDLEIVEAPPEDPFAIPVTSTKNLLQFSAEKPVGGRVKVQGVVTFHQPGRTIFVRDGAEGLRIDCPNPLPLQIGDVIEALGFPRMGSYTPLIDDATVRRIGHEVPPPPPVASSARKILEGNTDANLVTLEGDLLDATSSAGKQTLVVQSEQTVFQVHAFLNDNIQLDALSEGSRLRLTGIALIDEVTQRRAMFTPSSFRLLLRSKDDVAVLQRPSWWTPERLSALVGILSTLVLFASIWVWQLRRRVQRQTEIIREKVEREAVIEERARIAREFHDSLEQVLAGIRMQLNAAVATLPEDGNEPRDILRVTENMVRYSMDEAQRFVWNLRSRDLEENPLPVALSHVAEIAKNGSGAEVHLEVLGAVCRLPARVENHLLRIGQEAVSNAAKHGRANRIKLTLEFSQEAIRLSIGDNGLGFDPSTAASGETGHFGLLGMRERAEKLGGSVSIQSAPGRGTAIEVTVPHCKPYSQERNYEEEDSASYR